MDETRVDKYKTYRSSFTKQDSEEYLEEEKESSPEESLGSTTTLPLNEVIKEANIQKEASKAKKRIPFSNVLICLIGSLLVVSLIVIGLFAWVF